MKEPKIKTYFAKDENRVRADLIEEQRAFWVGLLTFLLILLFVLNHLYFKSAKKEDAENNQAAEPVAEEVAPISDEESLTQSYSEPPPPESSNEEEAFSQTYTVQSGDSLYAIAQKLNVSWQKIAEINNLESPYQLRPGQVLKIPQ